MREHGLVLTGRDMVCIDAVQAGKGELVILVQGSSSRIAPNLGDVPADAVIVGIVDSLQAMGKDFRLSATEPRRIGDGRCTSGWIGAQAD